MSTAAIRFSSLCAVSLLSGWLFLGAGVPALGSTLPCEKAVTGLDSGNLKEAGQLFVKVRPADLACVRQGLVATSAFLVARQLFAVGLDQAADAEVVRALQADPGITVPGDVLPATLGRPGIALAETLDAEGFHVQAVQILQRVIEHDPSIPLGAAARDTLGLNGVSFWTNFRDFVLSTKMVYILLAALVIGVTAYPRIRKRLHLQRFSLDDPIAGVDPADLRQQVADELRRLVDESARTADGQRFRLDLAGPYEDQWDTGSVVGQLPGPLQLLCSATGTVLKHLPSRPRLVTGALAAGVSVHLSIQTIDKVPERQMVIDRVALGLPDLGQAAVSAQYAQLAMPAAAWILLTRFEHITLGGTREWQSFAYFATGYAWQKQGRLDEARDWYRRACDEDRRNSAAAVNLSALQQRDQLAGLAVPAKEDQPWEERLRTVVAATEDTPDDLQRLRSFNLLSLGLQDAASLENLPPEEQESRRALARQCAEELAIRIEEAARRPGELPEAFIRNSRGAALSLVASLIIPTTDELTEVSSEGVVTENTSGDYVLRLLRNQETGTPEKLIAFVKGNCRIDDQVRYNLYRYYFNRAEVSARNAVACAAAMPAAVGEEREILQARLGELQRTEQTALQAMVKNRDAIGEDADPILRARVQRLDEITSEYRASDRMSPSGLGWPAPARHGPDLVKPEGREWLAPTESAD
jgi:tetratricopeptide (TPR) repeat protein